MHLLLTQFEVQLHNLHWNKKTIATTLKVPPLIQKT